MTSFKSCFCNLKFSENLCTFILTYPEKNIEKKKKILQTNRPAGVLFFTSNFHSVKKGELLMLAVFKLIQ